MSFIDFFFAIKLFPSLVLATIIFCYHSYRRKYFWLRFLGGVIVFTAVQFGLSQVFQYLSGNVVVQIISAVFSVLYFVMVCFLLCFCFRIKVFEAVCYSICGWSIEHLAYSLTFIFGTALSLDGMYYRPYGSEYFAVWALTYTIVYVAAFVIFTQIGHRENIDIQKKWLFVPAVILLVAYSLLSVWGLQLQLGREGNILVRIYAVLCCLACICIAFNIFESGHYKQAYETLQVLDSKREEQYNISQETIEMINVKCHDLKKMVASSLSGTIMQDQINEISGKLNIYDSIVDTGNKSLDLVLTEKSLYCDSKNIKLSVMADGKCLLFLPDGEVYSLFGNILDNAIEAVINLPESKRVVSLSVKHNGNIISIHSDNYFDNTVKMNFSGGLPSTTKSDKRNHGFGLLSIKRIAERYNGIVTAKTDDDIFNLDIIMNRG